MVTGICNPNKSRAQHHRRITSSAIKLKICATAAGIKKYKLITREKKHGKIVLLVKTNLDSI